MFPVPDPELAAVAVKEFLATPVEWYIHLALRTSEHARVSLSTSRCPAAFVAAHLGRPLRRPRHGDRRGADPRTRRTSSSAAATSSRWSSPNAVHELLLEFLERVG